MLLPHPWTKEEVFPIQGNFQNPAMTSLYYLIYVTPLPLPLPLKMLIPLPQRIGLLQRCANENLEFPEIPDLLTSKALILQETQTMQRTRRLSVCGGSATTSKGHSSFYSSTHTPNPLSSVVASATTLPYSVGCSNR